MTDVLRPGHDGHGAAEGSEEAKRVLKKSATTSSISSRRPKGSRPRNKDAKNDEEQQQQEQQESSSSTIVVPASALRSRVPRNGSTEDPKTTKKHPRSKHLHSHHVFSGSDPLALHSLPPAAAAASSSSSSSSSSTTPSSLVPVLKFSEATDAKDKRRLGEEGRDGEEKVGIANGNESGSGSGNEEPPRVSPRLTSPKGHRRRSSVSLSRESLLSFFLSIRFNSIRFDSIRYSSLFDSHHRGKSTIDKGTGGRREGGGRGGKEEGKEGEKRKGKGGKENEDHISFTNTNANINTNVE